MLTAVKFSAIQEEQIHSHFVDRTAEIGEFQDLLQSDSRPAVYSIAGDGGVGKTWLVLKLLLEASRNPRLRVLPLFDFYITEYQTVRSLRDAIVGSLGAEHFPAYRKALDVFNTLRTNLSPQDIPNYFEKDIQEQFIRELNELATSYDRLVLAFDTCEAVAELDVEQWLLQEMLPNLDRACMILAGRFNNTLNYPVLEGESIAVRILGGFPREDAAIYFEQRGLLDLTEDHLNKLWSMCKGRPLLMDMAADWLKENIEYDALVSVPEEKFEEQLVLRIRELAPEKSEALLDMAWAWRRFDVGMLHYLLNDESVDYDVLVDALARFSFVKYRAPINSFQLHDEARDLIIKHLWSLVDSAFTQRRILTRRIVEYYDTVLIPHAADDVHRNALKEERLNYSLFLDLGEAYENFTRVFDELFNSGEYELADRLLQIITRFKGQLSVDRANEIDLRRARIENVRKNQGIALSIWDNIFETSTSGDLRLDASRYRFFVLASLADPAPRDAELARADKLANDTKAGVSPEAHARYLSATAYYYRITGQWDRAIDLYNRAILRTDNPVEVSNGLNTLGYIYALKTDYESALEYCKEALRIRQEHRVKKGEGLSHSTLGEVYRYKGEYRLALEEYELANDIFKEIDDQENIHRVLQQRGICYVQMGEHGRARADLQTALHYYESSPVQRDYPRCLERLARYYYYCENPGEAERYFKLAHDKGLVTHDVDSTVVSLVGLATLCSERGGSSAELGQYLAELEKVIREFQYQNPQHLGQLHLLLGFALAREHEFDAALRHIAKGMADIAAQRRGPYLVSDYLEEIKKTVDGLPAQDEVIRWCRYLREQWQQPRIAEYHPELVSYCDIKERTSLFRAKGE